MADEIKQLLDMVANLRSTMLERFEKIDEKLEEHDRRFEKIESKLEEHDRRFEKIESKLEEHDERFESIEKKMEKLDSNQIKIINTINIFKHDIDNNKKHIEKLENGDDYLKISE